MSLSLFWLLEMLEKGTFRRRLYDGQQMKDWPYRYGVNTRISYVLGLLEMEFDSLEEILDKCTSRST